MKRKYVDVKVRILMYKQDIVTASNDSDDDPSVGDDYDLTGAF